MPATYLEGMLDCIRIHLVLPMLHWVRVTEHLVVCFPLYFSRKEEVSVPQ